MFRIGWTEHWKEVVLSRTLRKISPVVNPNRRTSVETSSHRNLQLKAKQEDSFAAKVFKGTIFLKIVRGNCWQLLNCKNKKKKAVHFSTQTVKKFIPETIRVSLFRANIDIGSTAVSLRQQTKCWFFTSKWCKC